MTEKTSYVKKFTKDFLKYSPSSIIPALLSFLTIPILTKLFSPSVYGNYVLAMVIVSFFASVTNALWGSSVKRFFLVYKNKGMSKSFYDTMVVVSIISILVIVSFFLVFLVLDKNSIDPNLFNLLTVAVMFFVLASFIGVLMNLLIVKQKASLYSIFTIIQSFGILIGLILIYSLKLGIVGIIWGNILAMLIILPFIYYVSFKGIYIGKQFSKDISLKLIKFGAPLIIGNLSTLILSISDRFILEFYKGSLQVGIYSASYSISEQTILMLWTLFTTASYPLILNTWENKSTEATQDHITDLTRIYLLLCIPAAFGLSILSKPVIEVLTSPAYYGGYIIIPLVVFGALLLGLQWWAQLGLLFNNKTHKIALLVLCAAILNIILNLFLIPIYGFIGAAVSTFISYFILLILIIKISNKVLNWNFPRISFFKIVLASVLMSIVVFIINSFFTAASIFTLIIDVIIGIFVYIILLMKLKEFKSEEIIYLKSLIMLHKK